ncbi:MAG: ABC transporter permease [Nocardioidaceae bacterium]|nr:ABC transporter permease [Nocardioidaceae bacterium]MCL2612143.1 ABC transporter permease [Nocardioidaceae bacterium]
MLSLTLRALRARPLRLLMSMLAVTLGVGFLAGVMVFSHALSATFDNIVDGSTPDGLVRSGTDQGLGAAAAPGAPLDQALVRRIDSLPQVARADGQVQGLGMTLLRADGTAVGGGGAPTITTTHDDAPNMSGGHTLQLTSGRWPAAPDEVTLDQTSVRDAHYRLGDEVRLLGPGTAQHRVRLVGTAQLTGGGTAGATLVVLSTRGAQELLLGGRSAYNRIALTAAPGVSQQQLVDAVQALLPAGYQAVTGHDVAQETQDLIGGFLDALSTFLLVFAIIAVVVSGFIIANTFTILVAQRTRELALLRTLGASRRQVRGSVLLEAILVGVVSSTIGLVVGRLLARLLAAALGRFGLHIGDGHLVLTHGSVVAGYVVGIVMTVVASYVPARRAGRIAPLAALRSEQAGPTRPSLTRVCLAILGVLLGVGCAYVGVGDVDPRPGNPAAWVGVAGVVWIVSLAALAPTLGRPVLWVCRSAYGLVFGVAGRLAGENAARDPRRTGATASALLIGLALVSTIAVLAASLNATIDTSVDQRFTSDFRVEGHDRLPFPVAVGDRMERVAGVASVSREQDVAALYDGGPTELVGVDGDYLDAQGLTIGAGSGRLSPDSAVVSRSFADDHDLRVGQAIVMRPIGTTPQEVSRHAHRTATTPTATQTLQLRVTGIFGDATAAPQVMVPLRALAHAGVRRQDNVLHVDLAPGAGVARVRPELERAAASAPYVAVSDKQEFSDQLHHRVNQMVYLIYGLLALAIVIAVLGIVNTLSLSVLERTRELGLLRAVGMSRAQVRRMVTLEAVAIALLGSVLGLGLGVLVGVLLQRSLASDLTTLAVPIGRLGAFLVVAVLVGLLAAVGPSIRAARMSPLRAAAD